MVQKNSFVSIFIFMIKMIAAILCLTLSVFATEYAPYDSVCDSMQVERCAFTTYAYHKEPIPKIIHQIWFGDASACPKKVHKWQEYADLFSYEYRFWDEKAFDEIRSFIHPENVRLIYFFISSKNYWSASDILRCELLRLMGGIYVDCDFNPPSIEDIYVEMESFVSLSGSVFLTENHAPNIREGALFVCNGFMASCQKHPIMASMCHQFSGNIKKFYREQKCYDARYITGPFLLNKVLNGSFQVIPIKLSVDLNMWH